MALRISSPLFVGRTEELAAFERLMERAAEGNGAALTVAGEAGIGKSRLVAEFAQRAHQADAVVLVGECVDLAEGELAFAPIVAALRPVIDDRSAVEELGPGLRSTLAALWPSLGEAGPASREQLFEGVYRVLARLARRRPVILIVEDVHWVDRSSRDLLAFLVRNTRRDRLVLVATYRPDELHRGHPLRSFLAELERSGQAERVELEPLGRAQLADQLAAIAGARPAAKVVEGILARSEGNPFFAEELLATADAGGGDELPGSLREALLLRFAGLASGTQEVLRAAAVVGRSVDHQLLGSVAGSDDSDLARALREATEQYVLVLTGHGTAYTFRHALLREAIYDDTLPGDRLRLHRAVAQILSGNPDLATTSAAAELAYHWHAAGELPAALRASLEAADEARRVYAYQESLRHIERAFSIWDRVEGPEVIAGKDRVELLLLGSQVADFAGNAERALALGEAALDAVDERLEPLRAAVAEMRIGRALWDGGRGDDAIEHLARARELVPAYPPSVERAEALAAEGRAMMLVGSFAAARDRLEQAREILASRGSPAVQASVLNTLAAVYSNYGEYERAISCGQEGLRIAREFGLSDEITRAYVNGSQAMDNAGKMRDALEMGSEGIEAARRLGMDRRSGDQLRVQAAWRLARMGRFAEAEDVLQPALEAASTPFNVAATKGIAGHLAAERGTFDLAERLLSEAWELMQRTGGFQLIGPNLAWIISMHLWRGQLAKARELVAEALSRIWEREPDLIYNAELYWLAVRIEADGAIGGHARALEILAAMDEAIARIPGDGAPPEALAFRALAGAELTRLGEPDPSVWRAAGDRFRALDERYMAAYADFRASEALAISGEPAEEPLRGAHTVAVEIGARPFQQEVEALAERSGVSLEVRAQTARRPGPRPERMLATVLFTDIVGSTAKAAELGDRRWREVLDTHDGIVRREVTRFGGEVVQFVGDGTLSTFDSPARAIDCACRLREAVKSADIQLRAGVHTGEIELRDKHIGGIAVHIGARVGAQAEASEILVSQTVTDLVSGSGIRFEPRGEHDLKGVPGRWRLYAVLGASGGAPPAPV